MTPTGDAPDAGAPRRLVEDLLGQPLATLGHDRRRLVAIAAVASGWLLTVLWFARAPRLVIEPPLLVLAMGAALGMLIGGMARERSRRSTRPFYLAALRAGAFLLAAGATLVVAALLNPVLRSGDSAGSMPLMALALVLLSAGALLWERSRTERGIAAIALLAVAGMAAGGAGLVLGEGWGWLVAAGFAGAAIMLVAVLAVRAQVGWDA